MATIATAGYEAAVAAYAATPARYRLSQRAYVRARQAARRAVLAAYPAPDEYWPDAYRSAPVTKPASRARYARRVASRAAHDAREAVGY